MDQRQLLIAMMVVAAVGVIVTLVTLRGRDRASTPRPESPFAASSEGEKLCPQCGMGNLWTDGRCISCGARLPESTS
jgi:hypothetical protein